MTITKISLTERTAALWRAVLACKFAFVGIIHSAIFIYVQVAIILYV